jgi:hypothetical protein
LPWLKYTAGVFYSVFPAYLSYANNLILIGPMELACVNLHVSLCLDKDMLVS